MGLMRRSPAVEDVGHVLQGDRFPDVHAHQHVAAADALVGRGTVAADGHHGQPAAVLRLELLAEFVRGNGLQFQPEQFPGGACAVRPRPA